MKLQLATIIAAIPCIALAQQNPADKPDLIDQAKDAVHEAKGDLKEAAQDVAHSTRSAWRKAKGFFAKDEATFRESATLTIANLSKAIAALHADTPAAAPKYFQTRLAALDQQLEHVKSMFSNLASDQIMTRLSGPRTMFDDCLTGLENALDQAENEVKTIARNDVFLKAPPVKLDKSSPIIDP